MTMRLTPRVFDTVGGPRKAWVLAPTEALVVGRDRLDRYRAEARTDAPAPENPVDRAVLDAVRGVHDPHELVVFRASSDDGTGSWGFDEALDLEESRELGYHLVAEQMPVYRRLIAAGVFALVHVEFGSREADAYQSGTRRVLDELEARSIPEVGRDETATAIHQVDRWILHNLTYFFTLDLDEVVASVLRKQLPLLEDRIPHLRQLVASLPARAID